MAIFQYSDLSKQEILEMADLAEAGYRGSNPTKNTAWTNVSDGALAPVMTGHEYINGSAAAEVFVKEVGGKKHLAISFRGTADDKLSDFLDYPKLVFGNSYIEEFSSLLKAVKAYASDPNNAIDKMFITGHSLGAAAANNLREVSATLEGGFYANARYVTFASPDISNTPGILNIGFENDIVFEVADRLVGRGPDFAVNTDHIVWYNDVAWFSDQGNMDPRQISEFLLTSYSDAAHKGVNYISAVERIIDSDFYDSMQRDSIVVLSQTDLPVSAFGPASTNKQGPAVFLGREQADTIDGTAFNDSIEGNGGDDLINGGAGNDDIRAGAGNDEVLGGAGSDTLDGGTGQDAVLYYDSRQNANVDLGQGRAQVGSDQDALSNFEDVVGSTGQDLFRGDTGDNLLVGLSGDDSLYGLNGNDTLMGGTGVNYLDGGAGNDVLDSSDALAGRSHGGLGEDTFIFNTVTGTHRIEDFENGQDFIMLKSPFTGAVQNFTDLTVAQVGTDTSVTNGTWALILENTQASDLDAGDFVFA